MYEALVEARPTWNIFRVPGSSANNSDLLSRSLHLLSENRLLGGICNRIAVAIGYTIWPQIVVPVVAALSHSDVIVCPNFVFPMLLSRKCLVIVHDVNALIHHSIPMHSSGGAPWSIRTIGQRSYFWIIRNSVKLASRKSGGIIVPTAKVCNDLKQVLPDIRVPIFVINWGIGETWIDKASLQMTYSQGDLSDSKDNLFTESNTEHFVLCVNPHIYDNIQPIIQAVAIFNRNNFGHGIRLVLKVVGHLEDTRLLPAEIDFLGRVSDRDLKDLYKSALAVGIATTDSGFGFPLLEALASGCPCIINAGTAEAEISSGHGVIIVSSNPKSWVEALETLISDPKQRLALSRDAVSWAAQFSWKRTGNELATAIETLRETLLILK